jgi:transcriptional regulator with XRE-family HTH domain
MFDLKSFRERTLKMTQDEFAVLIGQRQDYISRLEKNPSQIPLDVFITIANKTGMTLDQLSNYQKPTTKTLNTDFKWQSADFTKKTIIDYIERYSAEFKDIADTRYEKLINDLKAGVYQAIKKPKIAFVGRSDVGKSAMINAIIGVEKMPTSWSPTTSIIVYLKHISEKPDFISEDVWIFKASKDGVGWDDSRLNDEAYCQEWKLASGDIETLKSYGTRQGDNYMSNDAGSAVVFVDSDVLKNCDFIDLPGFGTGDREEDDAMTLNASQRADVIVYLSIANGFMRDEDMQYLHHAIKNLNIIETREDKRIPPLSNLFIVASQAHTVDQGNSISLKNILDKGCERFEKTITENFWTDRQSVTGYFYTHDIFRSRFFTYSTDIEQTRIAFESEMKKVIELLPGQVEHKAKEFVKDYAASVGVTLDSDIEDFDKMLNEKEKYESLLNEINKNEPARKNSSQNDRINVSKEIEEFRKASISEFAEKYGSIISVDSIVSIIKTKGFKKNKEDVQLLSNYVNSLVEDALQDVLKKKSEDLCGVINKYISGFQQSTLGEKADKIGISRVSFNATRAFASGLAGLATIGGLAFWASTLGNLGAYILLAKGVSLLAALGISVGGTAAAASAIAAIGGPIVIGIALAVIAALAVFVIFSGGWEKSLAKKLVKAYDDQDALMKYKKAINSFWEETQKAFNASSENMEKEWDEYVENLRGMIENYDINDIIRRINVAKEIKSFFTNIPL